MFIIGICFLIIILLEIIYRTKGVSISNFCIGYILVLVNLFFVPFTDIIEKYLMEFNFLSPFLIIMIEAIFGLIFVIIFSLTGHNPFIGLKK